ncbi:MAG: hypothetical protein V3U24_00065 [Candidatus Neomarinimicrobiota bacterium]
MSLKVFHIFFITVSILFSFGFGIWGLHAYLQQTSGVEYLWLGIVSLLSGAILVVYGIKVFQKLLKL